MTSLLREDKPWEQTAGPDGRLNPNSYSATAVFGIVEMAVELLHAAGVPLRAVGGDRAVPHPGAHRARRAAGPGRQHVLPGRGEHPAPRGAAHRGVHDAAAVRRGRAGLVGLGGAGDPAHRLHREGRGGPVRRRPGRRAAVRGPGGPGPSRRRSSRRPRTRAGSRPSADHHATITKPSSQAGGPGDDDRPDRAHPDRARRGERGDRETRGTDHPGRGGPGRPGPAAGPGGADRPVRRGDHRRDRPEIRGVPADRRRARQQGVHRRDHRGGARSRPPPAAWSPCGPGPASSTRTASSRPAPNAPTAPTAC